MMKGVGFLLVLVCSTALDSGWWVSALIGCAVGAVLMIAPMVRKAVCEWKQYA